MKNLFFSLTAVLAVFFVACGDDSNSSKPVEDEEEYGSSPRPRTHGADDPEYLEKTLGKCSEENDGKTASVDSLSYKCQAGEWVNVDSDGGSSDGKGSSSDTKDKGASSASEGDGSSGSNGGDSNGDESSASTEGGSSNSSGQTTSSAGTVDVSAGSRIEGDYLIDLRDNKRYKIVEIGGVTWMADNLNLEYDHNTAKSFCYGDDPANCDTYGRLYTWSAAMDSAGVFSDDGYACGNNSTCAYFPVVQGACPDGWHLPSDKEFEALFSLASKAADLQSVGYDEWTSATNSTGFSAIPSGCWDSYDKDYVKLGQRGYYWTTRKESNVYVAFVGGSALVQGKSAEERFSVRCVMNTSPRPVIEYGSLTDDRDGQTYKTVNINGKVWMAQNLNFSQGLSEGVITPTYDGKALDGAFGKLYTWSVAMDGAGTFSDDAKGCTNEADCTIAEKARGICPQGWHIPDSTEWGDLLEYTKLFAGTDDPDVQQLVARKITETWPIFEESWPKATNSTGFSALPVGYLTSVYDGMVERANNAYYWTSSKAHFSDGKVSAPTAQRVMLGPNQVFLGDEHKTFGQSVRCVQD